MNLFSFVNACLVVLCTALAIFIFSQAKNRTHRLWAIFNTVVALWGLFLFLASVAKTSQEALLFWKLAFIINTFISIFLYNFVQSFCQFERKRFTLFAYLQGIFFVFVIFFSESFIHIKEIVFGSNRLYFPSATPLISLWLLIFSFITGSAFFEVSKFLKISFGEKKIEALYLFWGMLVGFGGGYTIALPIYNFPIYPAWHFLVCFYVVIFTYAILRHRFLDIRITLIRFLIPVVVIGIISFIFCFTHFKMNLFATAGLSLGIACFLLAYVIACYARQRMHWVWALFNIVVGIFGFGTFLVGVSKAYDSAFLSWKFTLFGVACIAMFFYHVIYEFCGLSNKKILYLVYIHGITFAILAITTDWMVNSLRYSFNQFYYYVAGIGFNTFFSFWIFIVFTAFVKLYIHNKQARGLKSTQGKYLFWGMLLGFLGGSTTSIPSWGINIYPAWHFFICVYTAIATYAIFRYGLMDIRIAVTRVGIFLLVYSLILGLPFGLTFWGSKFLANTLGQYWYWLPIVMGVVFASTAPFIYFYFQRKAEDALLQEERRIQDLLSRVSVGMRTIRDLSKLSEFIVDILIKHLKLDNAAIYLYNTETAEYIAKVSEPERVNNTKFDKDTSLVRHLEERKYPVVCEEVKLLSDSEPSGNKVLHEVAGQMADLRASVIIPAMSENFLLGFIVLGERKDKHLYSVDLINVLSVLGNQAALAIENCHYIQRMQAEGLAERMISLDHMASSMAHEIDNPMHIIRTSLSFVKSVLLRDPRVTMPEEVRQDFDDSLVRSLNASERVSSMIKAVLDYSRMGTGKLESIRVGDALEGFLHLIHPQIREEKVQFVREIEDDLPPVLGDRVQMEEVFMNFVRNSLHAVRDRAEKKISLKIFRKNETIVRIECRDNGYGIPKEIINDIFLSSMTTKGSSEGTGLGLYRVRKIVDLFRGKVWAESEGKGTGATFIVELPIYDGNNKNSD